MPESAVAANLERMAGGPLRGDVLGVLFQVPELIVARRLQELGIDVAGPTPSDALPPDDIAAPGAPGEVAPLELPDRYVNLALAVYAERFMERDLLQQFLGMNELDTQRVVDWAQVPRRDLKSGELKGPVDPDVQ